MEKYLPGLNIPTQVKAYHDMQQAVENTELIVLAVPSTAVRECSRKLKQYLDHQIIVNVAKGIEKDTLKRLSCVIEEETNSKTEDINPTLSVITSNINGLNSSIKRQRLSE